MWGRDCWRQSTLQRFWDAISPVLWLDLYLGPYVLLPSDFSVIVKSIPMLNMAGTYE